MASTSSSPPSGEAPDAATSTDPGPYDGELFLYYGRGGLEKLKRYRRVVLQPTHYREAELRALAAAGTQPIAYLSLGEDTGPEAPWQRLERNPVWGGRYVHLAHPGWVEQVRSSARTYIAHGFGGLFLDTLDVIELFPEERGAMLELVARLREDAPERHLIANRGFALLPELAELVDGFLFEAFSSTWYQGGYAALPPADLWRNTLKAQRLQTTACDLYALDYALTPQLAAFARDRARRHGLISIISNRTLTHL